jgi:hypothetical protein
MNTNRLWLPGVREGKRSEAGVVSKGVPQDNETIQHLLSSLSLSLSLSLSFFLSRWESNYVAGLISTYWAQAIFLPQPPE